MACVPCRIAGRNPAQGALRIRIEPRTERRTVKTTLQRAESGVTRSKRPRHAFLPHKEENGDRATKD